MSDSKKNPASEFKVTDLKKKLKKIIIILHILLFFFFNKHNEKT